MFFLVISVRCKLDLHIQSKFYPFLKFIDSFLLAPVAYLSAIIVYFIPFQFGFYLFYNSKIFFLCCKLDLNIQLKVYLFQDLFIHLHGTRCMYV